jgi:hypothetical protein
MGRLLLIFALLAAVAGGCTVGSSKTDLLRGAVAPALSRIDQIDCSAALADLYTVEVAFIQGGNRLATTQHAHRVLLLARKETRDPHCSASDRRAMGRGVSVVRCDIVAARRGQYCPA